MSITINLSAPVEAALRADAEAQGRPVDEVAAEALERLYHGPDGQVEHEEPAELIPDLTPEETADRDRRLAALRRFVDRGQRLNLPPVDAEELRRVNLYAGDAR